ncbi:platelet glycoprotein 4-like isoform X2 [Tachypleus tridentatus]|uniref:platelet glycoprotein 4-like isoform X2 n=1 Tax=Tachypleus tridentatus TaxID=6853 RepID=UPI003FD50CB3
MVWSVLRLALLALGATVCISGGVLYGLFPRIIKAKIDEYLVLDNGTSTFENWKNIPVPIYVKFFIFNITNPLDVMNEGAKPVVKEIGPYTFKQTRKKEIVGWDEKQGTIQYKDVKTYVFQPDLSIGTQEEMVYVVNAPLLGIAKIATERISRIIQPLFMPILSSLLKHYKEELIIKRMVQQILFHGYEVRLLKDLSRLVQPFVKLPHLLPNNTFGLFYGKNDTTSGVFSVFTGIGDSSKFTVVNTWKNKKFLPYWGSKYCNMINGTDGGQFPPHVDKKDVLYVFSTDLCRSLYLEYEREVNILGIKAYRFTTPAKLFANPRTNPDNQCFCKDDKKCLHAGAIDLTTCKNGAPVVASAPHFYQGSKEYIEGVVGLNPVKEQHQTFLDIEPMTGLVLNARKRIQLSLNVKRTPPIESLQKINDVLIPIAWLSESASLDEQKATLFKQQVQSPMKIGMASTLAATIVGAVWTVIFVLAFFYFKKIFKKQITKPRATVDQVHHYRME